MVYLERFQENKEKRDSFLDDIKNKSELLFKIYSGGIEVLFNGINSDKIALSAHNFRDFIEKFPKEYAGVSIESQMSINNSMIRINNIWKQSSLSKQNYILNNENVNDFDDSSFDFLNECRSMFVEYNQKYKTRNQQFKEAYLSLDCINPKVDFNNQLVVRKISKLRKYFVDIAHHGSFELLEYYNKYYEFEELFVEMLTPQTNIDLSLINTLIEMGEKQ